ncbi:glycosyltransferase family 2 protein [Armatimonas rosea]|uniref:Glycosyltransferase involved in cell wall biosynthesis n=1 Tax=Armatimonas rosea TaxID=685828 RepID=A0A7W9SX02_ARMRO|nr:glycosyltransferase family A protein [Armatimonas rosea]MBB6053978.1 glycosyltransferase involved in cell wall biosynthesis [Armatimonas rosea]
MNTDPLVSVVVIFYNPGRFFSMALDSVLSQTYTHWELLLVDDGSQDGSSELAQVYAARHPEKIRYCQHPGGVNRGMSATRNLGLAQAQGELVALLDADDLWLPNKLAEQVGILRANPESVALFGRSKIWHSWDSTSPQADWLNLGNLRADRQLSPPEMLLHWLRDESFQPCTSEFIARTDILRAVGGWDESFKGLYEDNVLYTRLFTQFPVYAASNTWSLYRQHPDNCCHQAMASGEWALGKPSPAKERILLWIQRYLDDNSLNDPAVTRALRAALLPFRNPALYQARQLPRRVANKLRYSLVK